MSVKILLKGLALLVQCIQEAHMNTDPGGTYEYGYSPPPPPPPPHFRNQQKFTLGGDVNFNILNQSDNSHGRRVLISA